MEPGAEFPGPKLPWQVLVLSCTLTPQSGCRKSRCGRRRFQKNSIFHPSFFPYKVFIKKFVFLNFLLVFVTNPNSHPTSPAWDIYYPINTVRCIVYVAFSDGFLT